METGDRKPETATPAGGQGDRRLETIEGRLETGDRKKKIKDD